MLDSLFMKVFIGVIFFLVGTALASFSNVLIYRLPRHESLINPPSHCPNCDSKLAWYENIPILSWIFLRGKCHNCKAPISPRYLIVELCGGLSSVLAYVVLGFTVDGVIGALAIIILICIAFVDAKNLEIPLSLNISFGVLTVLKLVLNIVFDHSYPWSHYLIGFGACLVFFLGFYFLSILLTKKEGLGLGDVILFCWAGLYLSWSGVFLVLLASSVICSVVLLTLIGTKKIKREQPIGFGPFIAGSFIICIFIENIFLETVLSFI